MFSFPPMKTYLLYIKSHCEAPDYEDEIRAVDKEAAITYFLKRLNWGNKEEVWTKEMIENYVEEL
jgi:hypothetical protein